MARLVAGYLAATCLLFCSLAAAEPPAVSFEQHIRPLLKVHCLDCHGEQRELSGGLDLRLRRLIMAGGESGKVIVPGHSEQSLLIEYVRSGEMPPKKEAHLSAKEIALLAKWIDAGAPTRDPEPDVTPQPGEILISNAERGHWSFVPPRKAELSDDERKKWPNDVDLLLARQRQRRELKTVSPAPRGLLLRRLYLDLTGLPPSRRRLQTFLADKSDDAYENQVRALLDSPQYGERWARHWMDIWRYTDWYGLGAQLRHSQKHLWHWRDWIIESLNDDVGYDQMVRLMLAADEIAPSDQSALRANGFLARNYYLFNRTTWLDNTIEHTSKAFLGLTMNCCKCHDHKYDPLAQMDYYRMRAIFEPHQVRLDPLPGTIDLEVDGLPRVFDAHPDAETYLHIRGDEKNLDNSRPVAPGLPTLFAQHDWRPSNVSLPLVAHRPSQQPFVLQDRLQQADSALQKAREALKSAEKLVSLARRQAADTGLRYDRFEFKPADLAWSDDFSARRKDLWRVVEGHWNHDNGQVVQTETGATRRFIRSTHAHPKNFILRLRFTILGGEKWKSVGVNFDVHDDHEKLVYLSGVRPGSKLQFAYGTSGKIAYPASGRQPRNVQLNATYELVLAVRDSLLNVAINGRHALAYEIPVAHRAGLIDITAFDVSARYDHFELSPLPDNVQLVSADQSATTADPRLAELDATIASARVSAAAREGDVLRTALQADRTKLQNAAPEEQARRTREAALASRRLEAAAAEVALAEAELAFAKADTGANRKQAKQQVVAKRKRLEDARAAVKKPGTSYRRLHVSLKALEGPAEKDASRRAPFPKISTGRRSAFANWIVSHDNPLTARVAVNHVWLRHFGQPLVAPVTDFGLRTAAPRQQELLDHLAVGFRESGWSMKWLHRQLVTSRAYQLSCSTLQADPHTNASDAENAFYWRRAPVRMQAQVVRDSLLSLAGVLDQKLGGPPIKPNTAEKPSRRRSLYFLHSRDDEDSFLTMFDNADILRCYRRAESIIPQQALAMANSRLTLDIATDIATEIASNIERNLADVSHESFVSDAFLTILCRRPTAEETETCLLAMSKFADLAGTDDNEVAQRQSRNRLIHALLNHNDFVTIR